MHFFARKTEEDRKKKSKVLPEWLVSLLISTVKAQLPIGYGFPDIESEQSVWSKQATAPW